MAAISQFWVFVITIIVVVAIIKKDTISLSAHLRSLLDHEPAGAGYNREEIITHAVRNHLRLGGQLLVDPELKLAFVKDEGKGKYRVHMITQLEGLEKAKQDRLSLSEVEVEWKSWKSKPFSG